MIWNVTTFSDKVIPNSERFGFLQKKASETCLQTTSIEDNSKLIQRKEYHKYITEI